MPWRIAGLQFAYQRLEVYEEAVASAVGAAKDDDRAQSALNERDDLIGFVAALKQFCKSPGDPTKLPVLRQNGIKIPNTHVFKKKGSSYSAVLSVRMKSQDGKQGIAEIVLLFHERDRKEEIEKMFSYILYGIE